MIYINQTSYSGISVLIKNGKVFIDGNEVTSDGKQINIKVEGDIDSINVDCCEKIEVSGSVKNLSATSGDVICGDITNDVKTTSGDIECKNVNGNINTTSGDVKGFGDVSGSIQTLSGDVNCGNVSGNIKTMSGDIKHK